MHPKMHARDHASCDPIMQYTYMSFTHHAYNRLRSCIHHNTSCMVRLPPPCRMNSSKQTSDAFERERLPPLSQNARTHFRVSLCVQGRAPRGVQATVSNSTVILTANNRHTSRLARVAPRVSPDACRAFAPVNEFGIGIARPPPPPLTVCHRLYLWV